MYGLDKLQKSTSCSPWKCAPPVASHLRQLYATSDDSLDGPEPASVTVLLFDFKNE